MKSHSLALLAFLSPHLVLAKDRPAEIATDATIAGGPSTAPPRVDASDELFSRLLFKVDGGVALVERDTVTGFARLGAEVAITKDPERSRFVWGVWDAYEGWFGKGAGGFALPIVGYVGYRNAPFIATLGGGLNVFTIDHLDDDSGFGIFSPRGDLGLGVDLDNVVLMATADIQRRWLWGRDDLTMMQFGLSIGIGSGFRPPEPETQPRR